jgi:hypothetical protein
MGFLWALVGFWGLIGTFLALISTKGTFLFLLSALAPAGLLMGVSMARTNKHTERFRKILRETGVDEGSGFEYSENGTGIAVNNQSKTITLLANDSSKTFPYADIREWGTAKEDTSTFQFDKSWFFTLTVRDKDNPKWRIFMGDSGTRDRWMELMRQEINEH